MARQDAAPVDLIETKPKSCEAAPSLITFLVDAILKNSFSDLSIWSWISSELDSWMAMPTTWACAYGTALIWMRLLATLSARIAR